MAVICSICGKERSFWFRKKFKKFNGRWYCLSCAEKVKREDFCQKIKPYIEEGLVKEIYYNQMYSICNLANQTYGVFVYGLESFCAL